MTKSWESSKNLINNYLEDLGISYNVEHRNVKYPRLEFKSENKLQVILPVEIENEIDLLIKKRNWIQKKSKLINEAIESIKEYRSSIIDNEKILIFGQYYQINQRKGKNNIAFKNRFLEIYQEEGDLKIPILKKWLSSQLKKDILKLLDSFSNELNVQYKRVNIRSQRTKWGSCSSYGNLNFNLKLIALPKELIGYVVFHELNHFKNPFHNNTFWNSISYKYPDYKKNEMLLTGFWFLLNENELWNNLINF